MYKNVENTAAEQMQQAENPVRSALAPETIAAGMAQKTVRKTAQARRGTPAGRRLKSFSGTPLHLIGPRGLYTKTNGCRGTVQSKTGEIQLSVLTMR